ncbi:hypothetical protein [Methanolobus psychrotolerans]|uniref:hypothetical protein n=1 Tax=Methanolobus psychrotolerans TaxID=1874706 RepID=UPI000B919107|nr:hypothetical protein [Methanolobus psychrotolerans]
MKIMAFKGSPLKNENNATLREYALKGAETELIHLVDYTLTSAFLGAYASLDVEICAYILQHYSVWQEVKIKF